MATLVWPEPRMLIESQRDVLSINEDVAKDLEKEERPLVVVCIAGPYRTGKSYLMNRLAGRQSGFALGSTLESKTKGIWVWLVNHPLDSNKALLLMDTEGLEDAVRGNETYDMWICCLSVLLSSVFVYNATGRIENSTLERLRFVTEMSSHIRARSQEEQETDESFDEFFPSFILAVRDFFLKPEIDGRPVTSDEYMEYILLFMKKIPNPSRQERERLEIKMKLRSYFKDRKCFFFPSPVDRDDLLQIVDELPESDLKPTFLQQVALFCNHIYKAAPVKRLNYTQDVNGRILSQLARQYIVAIRSGAVPCIESAVDMVARSENNRALEDAVHYYCTEMRRALPLPVHPSILSETHQKCYKYAVELFLTKAFLDKGQEYHNMLQGRLQQEYVRIVQDDAAASWEKCQRILVDLFSSKIDAKSRVGAYLRPGGYTKYVEDLNEVKDFYNNTPDKGVKSEEAMQFALEQRSNEQLAIMKSDEALTEAQKEIEDERIRLDETNKRVALQQQEMDEMQRHQANLIESQKEHTRTLQQTFEKQMRDREHATEVLIEQRLAEKERLMTEKFRKEAEAQQELIDQLSQPKPNILDKIIGSLVPVLTAVPQMLLSVFKHKPKPIGPRQEEHDYRRKY